MWQRRSPALFIFIIGAVNAFSIAPKIMEASGKPWIDPMKVIWFVIGVNIFLIILTIIYCYFPLPEDIEAEAN